MMVINEENYRMWIGLFVFMIIIIFCWHSCAKSYSNTSYYSNTYNQKRDEDSVFKKMQKKVKNNIDDAKNKIEYKKLEIKNKVKRSMYKMKDNIDDVKDEIKYKKWELEEKLEKMVDD